MKKIIQNKINSSLVLMILFAVLLSFQVQADLSQYPNNFIDENKLNAAFVHSESASADEVIALSNIMVSLQQNGISIKPAKFSKDIYDIYAQNLIIVGTCDNTIISELLGGQSSCSSIFNMQKSAIIYVNKKGYQYLIVGTASPPNVRNAAQVLVNYGDYGLKGNKIFVTKNSDGKFELEYDFELSDFPEIFVKNGKLDSFIVVGDKASSSDVIAQGKLILFFGAYTNYPIKGAAKLATEINNLDNNLISIGNPCNNPVSAQILGNPQPCDKSIEKNKAVIKIATKGKFAHIIVMGYSDKGTMQAVERLLNYKENKLEGKEVAIEVIEEEKQVEKSKEVETPKKEDAKPNDFQKANIEIKQEVEEDKIMDSMKEEKPKDLERDETNKNQIAKKEQTEEGPKAVKPNLINRIINWFRYLFA